MCAVRTDPTKAKKLKATEVLKLSKQIMILIKHLGLIFSEGWLSKIQTKDNLILSSRGALPATVFRSKLTLLDSPCQFTSQNLA